MLNILKCAFGFILFVLILSIPACSNNDETESFDNTIKPITSVDLLNQQKYLLKKDNNVFSGSWGYWDSSIGQCVSFSPPVTPFKIKTIWVRAKRTDFLDPENKTYTLNIWDGNFDEKLFSHDYPYSNFSTEQLLVAHNINPPVIVTDNFTIDFISNGEGNSENKPKAVIYVSYDSTITDEHIGLSSSGFFAEKNVEQLIAKESNFSHAVWIIRAEGSGQATSTKPENFIMYPNNVGAANTDPKQSLFFWDDFSNLNNGWPIGQLNSGSIKYDDGGYIINCDRTEMHNYSKNKNIIALKDLIVEADVSMQSGSNEAYAELIVGWIISKPELLSTEESRPGNYYFQIKPRQETASIYSWEQAEWGKSNKNVGSFLLPKRYAALKPSTETNNLRLVFSGNKIKAYLNNTLMLDTTDENVLFGHRLVEMGVVSGKYIYLGAGKYLGSENSTFRFDNFKLYKGTKKAFLVPEDLKDSTLLNEKINAAENYGFDIGSIKYYGKTADCVKAISELRESQPVPVAIHIMYHTDDKSKLESMMSGYTGEAIYEEINLPIYNTKP